ncbi:hypothetical protein [Chelativorans sp. J32]|uniref:hypothetical protein n=1 Tax=Chelativorans sp. J32 TaxID=935840 RepID=UPI0004B268AB|nr:hypothetical protein [Chelativorans sp. J32]
MKGSIGTVLILGTYPAVKPKHGGQVRLYNIKHAYEAAGWESIPISVYPNGHYPKTERGPLDLTLPETGPHKLLQGKSIPFIDDLLAGRFAAAKDGGLPSILARIPKKIDVIHVEQPWLWPLAVELRKRPEYSSVVLIYGSQNIEAPLKRSIFEDVGVRGADDAIVAIEELERCAASTADLVLGVTEEDLKSIRKWGAKRAELLPNGIEPWNATEDGISKWREKLPRRPWLLYVASAHPPNFSRFSELLGESLACFPPTSRLVVAGSVSEHIHRVMCQTKWSHLNLSRLKLLFTLSDADLAAVKSLAHGFILPIPFGGGSNIKTAEALYSGAFVVGTPAAFRGYEDFADLPEVRVADNPKKFQNSIRDILGRSRHTYEVGSVGYIRRQKLRWDECLSSLPLLVNTLANKECV